MVIRSPGFTGTRQKQREKTRDHLVETALDLFAERGYVGVRVEDIAAAAGISRATFYKYFAEREEILVELFARLLGSHEAAIPPGEPTDALRRLADLLTTTAAAMVRHEQLARFVYSLPIRHAVLVDEASRPSVLTLVEQLLMEGQATDAVRQDVPLPVLTAHIGRSFEAAMRDWAEGRTDDAPGQVRQLLTLAIDGVRQGPA